MSGRMNETSPRRRDSSGSRLEDRCTNKANSARIPACQTKPIGPGRPEMGAGRQGREAPSGTDCAKQSQFPGGPGESGMRNKANPVRGPESQVLYGQSVMVYWTCMRNKANWAMAAGMRGANRAKQRRARQKSASTEPTRDIGLETPVETKLGDFCRGRQTNPISGSQRAGPGVPLYKLSQPHHSSIPLRGRLCETNPIPDDATWDGAWGTRASCAKQTQFGAARPASEARLCKTKPISGSPAGARERNARNKAKLGRAGVCGQVQWANLAGKWNVRNKPNSRQCRVERGFGDKGCCTNEPNSCHYADPEIGVSGRANRAKQSQFAATPRGTVLRGRGANARNKPNFPAGGDKGVVQTNPTPTIMPIRRSAFPGGQSCETNPIGPGPSRVRPLGGQKCQTNPIMGRMPMPRRRRSRKTKPIWGRTTGWRENRRSPAT
jgi:hypothetical protein